MEGEALVGAAMESLMPAALRAAWVEGPKAAMVMFSSATLGKLCSSERTPMGYGGVHGGLGVFELGLVEHLGVFGLLLVGAGEEEFLFAVLGEDFNELGEVLVAEENLAFAVLDVVLEVVGDGLGGAEVLHAVGDDFA